MSNMDNFTLCPVSGPLSKMVRNGESIDCESLIGMPIKTVDGIIIGQIDRIDKDADTWYGTIIAKYLKVGEPVSMEMVLESAEKKGTDAPIKTAKLCERCYYRFDGRYCGGFHRMCDSDCGMYDDVYECCKCTNVTAGDPCPYFKEENNG